MGTYMLCFYGYEEYHSLILPQSSDFLWAYQVYIYKWILTDEIVDMHPLNMFIKFKSEHLFKLVVFEGVYEEVCIPKISDEAIPSSIKSI